MLPNFRFLFSQKAHPTLPEIFYFLTRKWRGKLGRTQIYSTHEKGSNEKSRYISPTLEKYTDLLHLLCPFKLRTQKGERGVLLKSDFLYDTLALLAYHHDVVSTAKVEADRFVSVSLYKHLAFEVVNKYVSAIEP